MYNIFITLSIKSLTIYFKYFDMFFYMKYDINIDKVVDKNLQFFVICFAHLFITVGRKYTLY